jgi:hypothetical protein
MAPYALRAARRRNPGAGRLYLRQGAVFLAGFVAVFFLITAGFTSSPARAQTNPLEGRAGVRCFQIRNHAPYTVWGHAATADDHRANFHLKTGEGVEVCVTGPYYEGGKIELTTKTLIPTFTCRTVPEGVVTIDGHFVADGGTRTRINCR